MKPTRTLLPLLALALIPCIAAAQDAPPPGGARPTPESIMERLDKNKDGFISKDEVAGSRLADRFDELDTNKDGKLSLDELKAMRRPGG